MKCKFLAFFIIFFSCVRIAFSQWDAQLSQYWAVKTYYNPSFAGETDVIENTAFYRNQWAGLKNAPKTSMVLVHMPLDFFGKKHGVGVYAFNDKAGSFSNRVSSLQYTYKFLFRKGRSLNVGIQGIYGKVDFDASRIHLPGSKLPLGNDGKVFISDSTQVKGSKTFDMGLGVSWITPDYWVGFSVTHLWEPEFDVDNNSSALMKRAFYLVGGYNIRLRNPLFVIKPSMFIKSETGITLFGVTGRAEYARLLSAGAGWRKGDGFSFMLGVRIRNFEVGYNYDLLSSALSKVSKGSHEAFLKYRIPIEKKKVTGRQKSIRLL